MLRVAAGLLLAAIYLALAAPWTALARRWTPRPRASVLLHLLFCASLRVRVRRFGQPGPPARLLVANHVSWLDILVLGTVEPMAFLAKREVGAYRLTRWLVDLQGAVYVDRARKRSIPAVNLEMAKRMAAKTPVVLFAEATTHDGTRLLRYRSSHFEAARQAQAWVQPVYLDYAAFAGLPAARPDKPKAAWYGDMTFLPSLLSVIACGGLRCDVYYGDPFVADLDRKALARRAEAATRALKARAWRGFD